MHPAWSIIFFTTLSGFGYGLAVMLGLGMLDPALLATRLAHLLALVLIGGGLIFSTFHLRNPQRAWRALSQWRSSWLSREGVLAIASFVPLCAAAWLSVIEGRYIAWIGVAGAALALLTVYCTSMIYASLRAVQAWNTPLTSLGYLAFSLAGGLLLAAMFAALSGQLRLMLAGAALLSLLAAWEIKRRWRMRMLHMQPRSTPETATGLGHIGRVRLLERPHVNENYLTREMGFRIARKHARKLWRLAVALGGAIPAILLILGLVAGGATAGVLLVLAVLSHAIGVWTERCSSPKPATP